LENGEITDTTTGWVKGHSDMHKQMQYTCTAASTPATVQCRKMFLNI